MIIKVWNQVITILQDNNNSAKDFAKIRYSHKKKYVLWDKLLFFYQLIVKIYVDKTVGSGDENRWVFPVYAVYQFVNDGE